MILVSHFHGECGLSMWTDELEFVRDAYPEGHFTGMAHNEKRNELFLAAFGTGAIISVDGRLQQQSELPTMTCAVHGICTHGDYLCATDTSVDRLKIIDLDQREVVAEWAFGVTPQDQHHMNSCWFGEAGPPELYVSAFTLRRKRDDSQEGSWRRYTREGVILDLANWWASDGLPSVVQDGISHPHTVRVYGESLWWCESVTGTLWWQGTPFWRHQGYLRGLAFTQAHVYAATSKRSEFRGLGYEDVSRLFRINPTGVLVNELVLDAKYGEVFAIEHVPDDWLSP